MEKVNKKYSSELDALVKAVKRDNVEVLMLNQYNTETNEYAIRHARVTVNVEWLDQPLDKQQDKVYNYFMNTDIKYKVVQSYGSWYVLANGVTTMCICDSEIKANTIKMCLEEFLATCVEQEI